MKPWATVYLFLIQALSLTAQVVRSPDIPFGNTEIFGPIQRTMGVPTIRFQQVYSATDFSSMRGGVYITQIAFNYEPQGAFFGGGIASNVLVKLSTTQQPVDGLS